MKALLRTLLMAAPAVATFVVVGPMVGVFIDRRLGLTMTTWPIPGALLIAAGAGLAGWTVRLFTFVGRVSRVHENHAALVVALRTPR